MTEINGTSDKQSAESHAVDEVTDMFKGLAKKKKSKKVEDEVRREVKEEADEAPPAADGEFDPTALKKKKKV